MKKNRFLLLLLLTIPTGVFAQFELNNLIKGAASDAKYLSEGYVTPFMRAFGYGLNQGWYNTAKTHKFPGFDLTLTISPVYVPKSGQLFEVDNTKLNVVALREDVTPAIIPAAGKGNIPTFFGPNRETTYNFKAAPGTTFEGAKGAGKNFLPVPNLNLGIGLPKGFDLKIRYVPTIDLGQLASQFDIDMTGQFSLFGVGVMHDIKQYIPGIKSLPFDLSAFAGYTKMTLEIGMDTSRPANKSIFTCSATTIQGVVSKKIAVLTGYAGLGYNIATTKLSINGSYDLDQNAATADQKDPVDATASSSGPRVTAGLRLRLAIIAFHADYTVQKYNALTVGFGLNVR